MGARLQFAWGVARSLAIYHGRPWRLAAMQRFYARFLSPGDLAFDVGAHVGNRVRAWRRLGVRVVAVEPQPACVRVLRVLYGRDPEVRIAAAAVAGCEGSLPLHVNRINPTISTASAEFIACASTAPSFHGQAWREQIDVPATTLDRLIEACGQPRFVKIDIEGYEAEALAGLSHPLPALSVEFVPMTRRVAEQAIARLMALGDYRFNATYGDRMRLLHPAPLDAAETCCWLRSLGEDGPAGDLFACLDARLLR
jgi:FkbM family methyltransferase